MVRGLQDQVEELRTIALRNPAVPITRSTGTTGFTVVGSPSTPATGVTIGVSGGQVAFRHADGSLEVIPAPFTPATGVTAPDTYGGGTAPASYSQSWAQALTDAVAEINQVLRQLINNLRATGGTNGGGVIT